MPFAFTDDTEDANIGFTVAGIAQRRDLRSSRSHRDDGSSGESQSGSVRLIAESGLHDPGTQIRILQGFNFGYLEIY
jgi:hypothetical protein